MTTFRGPRFQLVEELAWERTPAPDALRARSTPLLVKGVVKSWPAWQRWSFERLAERRRPDGSEVICRFQNGLVEQGETRQPLLLPLSPYLQELLEAGSRGADAGLLPDARRAELVPGEPFHLDWSYLETFQTDRVYLGLWPVFSEFPDMRADFDIRLVWPKRRLAWEYMFIGPAHTVTGLHYDRFDNWFCQVRGTKDVLLFPPDQGKYLSPSLKHDRGAVLSDIDIAALGRQPELRPIFERAEGRYVRVEAGDALFIPNGYWHSVVALEPSISLAVFGLTPWELVSLGVPSEVRHRLHMLHLHRWGNCTCHGPARTSAKIST